jgi:hypothetical protein
LVRESRIRRCRSDFGDDVPFEAPPTSFHVTGELMVAHGNGAVSTTSRDRADVM